MELPCYLCSELGHCTRECPILSEPLKEGFYSGGGSGDGQHTHDDDD